MKLWVLWGMLLLAYFLGFISRELWPQMDGADFRHVDWSAVLFITPFHILAGFFFLIFFLLCIAYLIRKLIYEFKVAFILRTVPIGALLLSICVAFVYVQMLLFYGYLALIVSLFILIYEWFVNASNRKSF